MNTVFIQRARLQSYTSRPLKLTINRSNGNAILLGGLYSKVKADYIM